MNFIMKSFLNIYLSMLFASTLVIAGDILGSVGGSMTKNIDFSMGHGCIKLEDSYKNICKKDPSGDILFKCYQKYNTVLNNKLIDAGVDRKDIQKMNNIRNKCSSVACNPNKSQKCGKNYIIEFKNKYLEKSKKLYFENQNEFTNICAEVEKCLKQ